MKVAMPRIPMSATRLSPRMLMTPSLMTPKQMLQDLGALVFPERVSSCPSARRGGTQRIWDAPEEQRQGHGFEFADIMEQGIAPGISADYIQPPSCGKEVHLLVTRSKDRGAFVLSTEARETLLIARETNQGSFDIFITRDGDAPSTLGPAFTLEELPSKQWVLCSVRCERCDAMCRRECGIRELARITHYSETIGNGNALCMDVEIPCVRKDSQQTVGSEIRRKSDVWCTHCGDCTVEDRCEEITSRRPKWNSKVKRLMLDFRDRCHLASAKNIQLERRGKRGLCKLLFGKVGENLFVLDYRAPFSAVQAFAATLTVRKWT
eukprot:TRINITY_DN56528_c0_g1_i1.p1 TRINITY_DN56528_c0_g1~~TRINITY_DN56528_c0_g1_i1.p1  ORF type:complete len:362 (-),score=40.00 TRINITY_DN56528_c0_g1_i1:467-1432(-)